MTKQEFRKRLSGLFIEQVSGLRDDVAAQTDQLLEQFEDEAIAHGMTISAEIADSLSRHNVGQDWVKANEKRNLELYNMGIGQEQTWKAIRTARDNKVWRMKE